MKKSAAGFTLTEILVAVTIVGVLSAVVYINFGDAGAQSRDAKRKTDLKTLQAAIELYKNDHGRYPEGCNGFTTNLNPTANWSGQPGSGAGYECATAGDPYIIGLAPKYIPVLPVDPKLNGAGSGYVYTTNTERSVYKIMALNTVELEVVQYDHPLARCGKYLTVSECTSVPLNQNGNQAYNVGSPRPAHCKIPGTTNDYAVSGGYSGDNRGNTGTPERGQEYDTDIVRCK